jgi:hypothetical protein
LLEANGTVTAFGDATNYGNAPANGSFLLAAVPR